MATPILKYPQNSLKFKNKSNLISLWGFVLSIFIYVLVFYVFSLSPSTVLCTTNFWFLFSNTLILIIAADFDAFSSSKKHDFYNQQPKHDFCQEHAPDHGDHHHYSFKFEEAALESNSQIEEKRVDIVMKTKSAQRSEEKNCVDLGNPNFVKLGEIKGKRSIGVVPGGRKAKCARSYSDKAVLMSAGAAPVEKINEKVVLQRTVSSSAVGERMEENEFSRMSDEELNRRVEEFIMRFNRQMRRQNSELCQI